MTPPPLAIVQARMGSTRFPGKMIAPLGGRPLIWHAWRRSIEAFGEANVVVAMPNSAENDVLAEMVGNFAATAQVFRWDGPESDVLGRFFTCAHTFRWHPQSVICRVTPDDPFKDAALMLRVSMGERHPVEMSCEAVTLEYLNLLHSEITDLDAREHLTHILSPLPPPPCPPGVWTVDTEEDLKAIKAKMEAG